MEMKTEQSQDKQPQADKPVQIMNGSEHKTGDFCLVCCSKVDRYKIPKESSLLSNNLNVIFLLRNLLQVPSDLLIGNFKKCGSPFYWISLCENCSQLTSQAMEHHLQILKLVNQLRSVLKIITDKMRESSGPSETMSSYQGYQEDDKTKTMQEKRLQILKRTREFVTNYDYNIHLVNPFIKGDKLAKELDQSDENEENSLSDDSEGEFPELADDDGWRDEEDKCTGIEEPFKDNLSERRTITGEKYVELDGGQWKCPYCEKICRSKHAIRNHRKIKHPEIRNPFRRQVLANGNRKCRYCEKEFVNRKCVWIHEKQKHPEIPGQFKCDICGKAENSKTYLRAHRYSVHKVDLQGNPVIVNERPKKRYKYKPRVKPEDPSFCHLCGKKFAWGHLLKRHLKRFHEKKFDIHCHVCGLAVYASQNLKLHLLRRHKDDPVTLKLIEDGVRLWKCGVVGCRAQFLKQSGLQGHTKKVHGDGGGGVEEDKQKRFNCSFCGKLCRYWHRLKVHEMSHAKEKPFSCDICGANFKYSQSVKKHNKRYHPEINA